MLDGKHYQNAYITRDTEKAAQAFRERADVDKVHVFEVEVDVTTPQGSGKLRNKLAFLWRDNLQYELIEPVSGLMQMYSDALPAGDESLTPLSLKKAGIHYRPKHHTVSTHLL
jgi:hypothetical protein